MINIRPIILIINLMVAPFLYASIDLRVSGFGTSHEIIMVMLISPLTSSDFKRDLSKPSWIIPMDKETQLYLQDYIL